MRRGPFRMLAEESGISFPVFDRHLDDLEAVCLLKEIVTLGIEFSNFVMAAG